MPLTRRMNASASLNLRVTSAAPQSALRFLIWYGAKYGCGFTG